MASKKIKNADGTTSRVLVGSKADPASKNYVAPEKDNKITNEKVKAGILPASQIENVPQTKEIGAYKGTKLYQGENLQNRIKEIDYGTINNGKIKPETPITLQQPPAALENKGLQAEFQQSTDSYTAELQRKAEEDRLRMTSGKSTYEKFLEDFKGETGLTDEAYSQKGGVDDVQKELNDINQKILVEQTSLQRKLEQLEKNSQGLFAGALQDQMEDVERESLRKQADLSIIQQGIQGRYDSAKSIADRAVSAYLEKQKIQNDILQFNYQENKDLFTRSEQRAFESAQNDRNRKLDEEKANKTAIYNLAIDAQKAGASTAIVQSMMSSTTKKEALQKAGNVFAPKPTVIKRDTQVVDGKLVDMQTGEIIADLNNAGSTVNVLGNAIAEQKIDNINNVLNNPAINTVVGTSGLTRTQPGLWGAAKRFVTGFLSGASTVGVATLPTGLASVPAAIIGGITTGVVNSLRGTKDQLTGDRQSFIGTVEQMRAELTKEKLAQAKGQGVTFGALSDGERGLIANAASKLGTWAITENGEQDGKVIGYDVSEKDFKKEMDVINYFTKLDALLRGAKPEDLGVQVNPDGSMWILNSDGTLSEVKRY